MNERFLNICINAGINTWPFIEAESINIKKTDLKKFAELMILECCGIVADAVDHREPASTYVVKIKQHFGVEQ
jgi:hypothetical protein